MPIIIQSPAPISPVTTALDIIKRAMRLIGVLSKGDTPDDQEAIDGLTALNALMSSLSNNTLLISALTEDSHPLVSGTATYSIGPSGSIETVRPMKVDDSSYILQGGLSYPLTDIGKDYNSIPDKSASGDIPEFYWYEATYPNAQITFYPIPGAGCTLKLWSWKQLQNFPTLTTQVSLPPGWEDCLAFNLAVKIAPEYQTGVSPDVSKEAILSKKRIKRTNTVVPRLALPAAVVGKLYKSHIESDT